MNIQFHGHSCFTLSNDTVSIIIDPFLTGNPVAKVGVDDITADVILLTHGHSDHFGDTVALAQKNDALVIAPFELALYCQSLGLSNVHPMHIGGSHKFDFGTIKLTPALHGSSVMEGDNIIYTGNPCGYLVTLDGKTIYHAGDTGLSSDMSLIGSLNNIDVALLPIGDNFVMGIEDAVQAVKMLKPHLTIPMHYNTFELIEQDPNIFTKMLSKLGYETIILQPEETISIG